MIRKGIYIIRPRRLRGTILPPHPAAACHCGECLQCGVVLCNKGFDFQKCQLFSEINGRVNPRPPPKPPPTNHRLSCAPVPYYRVYYNIISEPRRAPTYNGAEAPIPDNKTVVSDCLDNNRRDAYVLINSLGQILFLFCRPSFIAPLIIIHVYDDITRTDGRFIN